MASKGRLSALTRSISTGGFNEITKQAVQDAFSHPGRLDDDKVQAQTRRFLDRVVGFMLSRLYCGPRSLEDFPRGGCSRSLSACSWIESARFVRSCRRSFGRSLPTRKSDHGAIRLQVAKQGGKEVRPSSKDQTDKALARLTDSTFSVVERSDKKTQSRPSRR